MSRDMKTPLRLSSSKRELLQNDFQTPKMKLMRLEKNLSINGQSPAFNVPPSPCLTQLGFGTGVKVLLYERSPRSGGPRSPWAIKKLSKSHATVEVGQRLEAEAKILKSLDHPNIIGYRGFKRSDDGSKILALETGSHVRSLFDIIEDRVDDFDPLPAENILFVVGEVAKALDYLHGEKRLLHGDLKSANVLVVGDFDAVKLCDFGVTMKLDERGLADRSRQYVGTEPWSAPEVVAEEDISDKTDIFALGCTIFEMLALDTPHADKLPDIDESVESDTGAEYDDSEFSNAIGTRPELPEGLELDDSYEKVLSVFYACTTKDPLVRPTARKIVELVGDHRQD